MPNIKTYDLLECSRLYPTIEGVNNVSLAAYVNLIVELNGDNKQSYTIKENVQGRFFAPTSADGTSDVQYSVTSIKFNGYEVLTANANLTVEEADNIYVEFPYYGAAPNGYSANVANAVTTEQTLTPNAYFERNFIDFMQTLFDTLGINAEIRNSHPDWWSLDGFEVMKNFLIEIYSSDELIITIDETYNGTTRELKYELNGTGATAYIDGVDVTVIPVAVDEQPQFADDYSIHSNAKTITTITEIDCCPVLSPFYASLENDCSSTLNVDCDCSKITFTDSSLYDNGLVGHNPEYFNHRMIILTRPDGTNYIWSTDGTVGQTLSNCGCGSFTGLSTEQTINEVIAPHWNSNNIFTYNLLSSDVDGIYSIKICTFPDWQAGVYYEKSVKPFVYRNGLIYKLVASSTGVDPELDTDNEYWIQSVAGDDFGRYCSEEKIVLLCISICECYKKAVTKALCGIEANPCADMCDNKALMKAMKMRITMDALGFAVEDELWDLAKEHMEILKSICCCNG